MADIKKDLLFKLLGMIVANKKDNTKISFSVSKNDEPINDPDPDKAVDFDFKFLFNHTAVLDVNLETMISEKIAEKKIQKVVYSYSLLGGSNEKKVSMVIVIGEKEQFTSFYFDKTMP